MLRRELNGAVEQTATNRIEVIRTEISRALHDHKERTDRLIEQLTARVAHLEALRGRNELNFFDISDHDADISRPADLPPVPGSLFPGRSGSTIPRSSLVGPIDHGSPSGCNAAPAEKASTVPSQTSCQNLDEILRRARHRVDSEHVGNDRRDHNHLLGPKP